MVEREHTELGQEPELLPAAGLPEVLAPGSVEFRLVPGQRIDISISAEGIVRMTIAAAITPNVPVVEPSPLPNKTVESPPPSIEQPRVAAGEKQPRETFRGTVSTHPRLEKTPKGVPKTVFRLAIHPDEQTTTFLPCVAFDNQRMKLAQQVYQKVHKGEAVEVVGYRQERQRRGADGEMRMVAEVYVAAVRHQKESASPLPHTTK